MGGDRRRWVEDRHHLWLEAVITDLGTAFERTVDEGEARLYRTWPRLLATGMVGGADVSLGVFALLIVRRATGDELLAAVAFSIGFVALTLANSELFTENFLVPLMAVAAAKAPARALLRLWAGTFVTNLVAGWLLMALVLSRLPAARTNGGGRRAVLPDDRHRLALVRRRPPRWRGHHFDDLDGTIDDVGAGQAGCCGGGGLPAGGGPAQSRHRGLAGDVRRPPARRTVRLPRLAGRPRLVLGGQRRRAASSSLPVSGWSRWARASSRRSGAAPRVGPGTRTTPPKTGPAAEPNGASKRHPRGLPTTPDRSSARRAR